MTRCPKLQEETPKHGGIRQSNKWTLKRSLTNKIPTSNETLLFFLHIRIMKGYKLRRHLGACSTLPPTSEFQVTKKYQPTLTFWIKYQKSENKQHLGKGHLLLCRNYITLVVRCCAAMACSPPCSLGFHGT